MRRNSQKLIKILKHERQNFKASLRHGTKLEIAYLNLVNHLTCAGCVYHRLPFYVRHLVIGIPLVDSVCTNVSKLTKDYHALHHDWNKQQYLNNLRERRTLCRAVANVSNLRKLYYLKYRPLKVRLATKQDVFKAIDARIKSLRKDNH